MSIYGHFIEESTSVVALPEDLVSESVILEMKAKQIDLDDFKSASEAVKYICSYYINIIDTEDKVLTEITNRLERVKNENQLNTLAKDINSKYPEMTKAAYGDYDKSKGGDLNTTFNNPYGFHVTTIGCPAVISYPVLFISGTWHGAFL